MSYSRQPLLSQQQEADLKLKMEPLWNQEPKLTGMEIAKKLKFGQPGEYAVLQPRYIYFYRQRFNLPIRAEPRFKKGSKTLPNHRYKKTAKELKLMKPETFVAKLNEALPRNEFSESQRCFLIILYHTGLRVSELYERVVKDDTYDFEILPDKITIHLLRKKKHFHKEPDEPISIPRSFPLVEEVVTYLQSKIWEKTSKGEPKMVKKKDAYGFPIKVKGAYQRELNRKPFPISKTMADNWIKFALGEDFYNHYLRYNFITSATEVPGMRVSELIAKTHLSVSVLETYIFTPERAEADLDAKKVAEMKKAGVIQ